ncbi:DUF485 domain-containing protein [Virgibacillus kimchii]
MTAQQEYAEAYQDKKMDYVAVEKSSEFKRFMGNKKKFTVPFTIFFLIFYFTLPVLTSYTTFLNASFFGDISWVWVFAFSQFVMVWVLCTVYVRKAASFDKKAKEIIDDQINKGGRT